MIATTAAPELKSASEHPATHCVTITPAAVILRFIFAQENGLSLMLRTLLICPSLLLLIATPLRADESEPSETPVVLETIKVLGSQKGAYTVVTEDTQKLLDMPGALGDPLGAISALPGVLTPASGGEPAVRGSSPNDNRYYIDGMPAGYVFHQFNTSILDENIVQNFQLYSAGFGAQYADATGAVFDIRLRDPRNTRLETTLTASFLRTGLLFEGGVSDSSQFYLSARMGMLQFFFPADDEPNEDGVRVQSPPEDNDYVFKYLWDAGPGKLSVNLIGASDFAAAEFTGQSGFAAQNPDFAGDAQLDQEFHSQSINWLQTTASGQQLDISFGHYVDGGDLSWGEGYFQNTNLDNNLIRASFASPVSNKRTLVLGLEYVHSTFDYRTLTVQFLCTEFDADCQDGRGDIIEDSRVLSFEQSTLYAIDRWQLTPSLLVEAGLQFNTNSYTEEQFFNPRLSVAWRFLPSLTLTGSAGRYNRLPDLDTVLPVFGNPQLNSPQAQHYTLGLKGDVAHHWSWSLETYYKTFADLPLALDAAQPDAARLYSNDVEGRARGVDLFLNRHLANNWYGWLALSYAQSERTNLRNNQTQDYALDTPLVFNMVANYQISRLWDAGIRFTAKSGEADTRILGIKENPDFPGNYLPIYSDDVNGDRLPAYSRLDFRLNRDTQIFRRDGRVFIDVLNLLGRDNVESRGLDYETVAETGELHIEEEVDMGRIFSIGFSVTF